MALGARFGAIARLIGREAGVLTVGGIVIGALVAVGVSRILESRLFGVERLDPVSFGAAAALFVVAGLAAAWSPLRVAGRVDPTEALRQE